MAERRRRLEESARVLRSRLEELRTREVRDVERSIHEVALQAVRSELTVVGHALSRMAG